MLFPRGPKSASKAVPYEQARELQSMVLFAMTYAAEPAKATQLLSDTQVSHT